MANLNETDTIIEKYMIVAAIDFGTTFSGYAWATRNDLESNDNKWFTPHWTGRVGSVTSPKTSSCVLYKPDGTVHSCGYEAEDHYSELALDGEHSKWRFFKRFKMILYNQMHFKRDAMIEDDKGKSMKAIDVFTSLIKYMKTDLTKTSQRQSLNLLDSDIKWVLTVPAIWTDSSKQFMREAAENAGIPPLQLTIALEPECGAFYCRHLPIEKLGRDFKVLSPGTQYMVLDCGGGTVDIAVHEVLSDSKIKELYNANGGDWGGTKVDAALLKLLSDIVGKDIFEKFCSEKKYDELELLRDFEIKKRTITPDLQGKITFKVPITLSETFKAARGKELKTLLDKHPLYKGKVTWVGDKVRMDSGLAKSLYDESRNEIRTRLQEILMERALENLQFIVMIGGFSESPLIQDVVQEFVRSLETNINVVVPDEAGLAVLKGAVIYGHTPYILHSRVCRYTYGIELFDDFDPNQDPADFRDEDSDEKVTCRKRFMMFVNTGTEIIINQSQYTHNIYPHYADQTRICVPVYATTAQVVPRHVTGCTRVGTLSIDSPDTSLGKRRKFKVTMQFEYTESTVTAIEEHTGKEMTASFNFLG